MNPRSITIICSLFFAAAAYSQTSQPALIDVADKGACDAHMGEDVDIQGVVSKAQWSQSGAVLNIDFTNAEKSRIFAVIFQRNRVKIDEAFLGDVAKVLSGSKVRIHGKLEPYDGPQASFKGRPQVIITLGAQITILEPGPGAQK